MEWFACVDENVGVTVDTLQVSALVCVLKVFFNALLHFTLK